MVSVLVLQVSSSGSAHRICTLLNDPDFGTSVLPHVTHSKKARLGSMKTKPTLADPGYVVLSDVLIETTLDEVLSASSWGLRQVVRAFRCQKIVEPTPEAVTAAALEMIRERTAGARANKKVAVRCVPRSLEKPIVAALLDLGIEPSGPGRDLAVHGCILRVDGTEVAYVGVVGRNEDWVIRRTGDYVEAASMVGRGVQESDSSTLCRATHKMREALQTLESSTFTLPDDLSPMVACDVGAAPGGWTAELARRGFGTVLAIDPAEIDADVLALPAVTHYQSLSQDVKWDHKSDLIQLLVCDANVHPNALADMLSGPLRRLAPGGIIILTLKFGGKGFTEEAEGRRKSVARKAIESMSLLTSHGLHWGERHARVVWLVANTKCERTLIARHQC